MSRTHVLYRFYASDGELLYVGITNDPSRRWTQHRHEKSWWNDIANVTLEHFETREELRKAERDAIENESPTWNIQMNQVKEAEPDSLPCGLSRDRAYALGLSDGKCPVGIVDRGDASGVVIHLYSWMTGFFGAGEVWIRADSIERWIVAQLDEQGVHQMDSLGDFQSRWRTRERLSEEAPNHGE